MKLRSIRIEQFRKFRTPIAIHGLETGINLFSGANEAGKSTLVNAIRAAFLERHRSTCVDDLRPWGESAASPGITLEFEIGDTHYRLSKHFLNKKRCELRIDHPTQKRHYDGNEAEDLLAELLGFQFAGKGLSKTEHWGIPGLLWINQGATHEIREAVTHATGHLRGALNTALGELTSQEGDGVLARVETLRNELLTASTGKPRGALAEALAQENALNERIRQIDPEIAAYRQKVDTLARLRQEHATEESEKPWAGFRQQQQHATTRLEEIHHIEKQLQNEQQQAAQVEARLKLLLEQLAQFEQQQHALAQRRDALTHEAQAHVQMQARLEQWQNQHTLAMRARDEARTVLHAARLEDDRRTLTRQYDMLCQQAATLANNVLRTENQQAQWLHWQQQQASLEITQADLDTLREWQHQLQTLQIRQDNAATQIDFTLEAAQHLFMQPTGQAEEQLQGRGSRALLARTRIQIPGIGQIEITPGGNDLDALRHEQRALQEKQGLLLQRLGLNSLSEAENRYQAYLQARNECNNAQVILNALAPQGLQALRSEHVRNDARCEELRQHLARLPASDSPATHSLPTVATAESAAHMAEKTLETVNTGLQDARIQIGHSQTRLEGAQQEVSRAEQQLAAPERHARLAETQQALLAAQAEQAAHGQRMATMRQQIGAANPDFLRQDIERFGKSAAQLEKRFHERRDEIMRIEIELQSAGAQGQEEQRAEWLRDFAQAQRRSLELRRRAQALDLLLQRLREKRQALTRRLQAPLQRHLNRYLQLLFPQATLEIDENLSPGPLTRPGQGGESGAFDTLSFGAREQMSIISRLAYADLLREAGHPTLIMLDDALVHSDAARLTQMKRVLFDAATRHQILLFTCHPENWRDLGVTPIQLESLCSNG